MDTRYVARGASGVSDSGILWQYPKAGLIEGHCGTWPGLCPPPQFLPVLSCPSRGFLASALQGYPGDEGLAGPQGPQGPYVSTGTKQRGVGCPLLPICTLWVPPTTRAGALK